jgi:chromosome segregation ATPase
MIREGRGASLSKLIRHQTHQATETSLPLFCVRFPLGSRTLMRPLWRMRFKLPLLAAAVFVSTFEISPGQTAPAIDLEARKASVANLESHIAQREARLEEIRQDVVTLDARIEKRLDELVKMLAQMTDSQDSKGKISQIKEDAIQGLRNAINLYVTKRKEMRERARTGDETLLGDLEKFDQRIATRVAQIVELSKSFPAHEDVDKYEDGSGGGYWDGYYNEGSRISEEWKQSRRDATQSKKQREEVASAIREGVERLDQRRRSLKELLDNRNPTETARKLYIQELGQIDAQAAFLKQQLAEATLATGGATQQPSLDEAVDIGHLLEDARKDLRADVTNLFRLYDEFARGRTYVNGLKENLAARKAWLEKNAPAGN